MNLLELWDFEKSQFFQEVGSRFHKRFDQLFDHRKFRLFSGTADLFFQ